MAVRQTFVCFSHVVFLIFIFLDPCTGITPSLGTATPTNTTTTAISDSLDLSLLDSDDGIYEFSTWESVSMRRILVSNENFGGQKPLRRGAACKSSIYGACISYPSRFPPRPCTEYIRCKRGPHAP